MRKVFRTLVTITLALIFFCLESTSPSQTANAATALAISTTSLPQATVGDTYSTLLKASGGTGRYNWKVVAGAHPSGFALDAGQGRFYGKPVKSGSYPLTFSVTDSSKPAQTKTVNLTVVIATSNSSPSSLSITSATLAAGTDGTAYSSQLKASGGTPAYTWSITSGKLPAGLTLAATTGMISGTPTVAGTSNFTATVTDNSKPDQSKSAATSIAVATEAPQQSGPGTTWYIRPDGGSRYSAKATTGQCDGKADVAYSGSGTNQHCAFKDPRYLWDDQSYGNNAWVIAGGDTVILRGGPWRIGFDKAPGSCSGAGCGAGYTWCFGGGGNYGCYNPRSRQERPASTPVSWARTTPPATVAELPIARSSRRSSADSASPKPSTSPARSTST
ncbi:Ig domain-containing protein [Tunturiibacter gelidiferens]|uniref:Ig domain-containing protein n=1 Tax=Tunturiibacter gelidiferens TaxID=3069689 RepID=UPI003D9B41D2